MANWKFLVVRHFGGSNQRRNTCLKIKENVENLGLSSVLPLAKYEISRSKEYYLGLAFDDSIPEAVEYASQVLNTSGVQVGNNSFVLEPEEVRTFIRGNIEFESFTIPLIFEKELQSESISIDQILSFTDVENSQLYQNELSDNEKFNKLLYWFSSVGSGSFSNLKKVCNLLDINTDWGGIWSIVRRFTLLGHIEFDMTGSPRWGVVPTVLVKTSDSENRYLAGARVPSILEYLKTNCDVTEIDQHNGPKQILINRDSDLANTMNLPKNITILDCVADDLSQLLPNFTDWENSLPIWQEKDFSRYTIEMYSSEEDTFFLVESPVRLKNGLYRFTNEDSHQNLVTIAYFNENLEKWICGDYYSIRFLTRQRLGLCQAYYFSSQNELRISVSDRWPMPFERALVLASGLLPVSRMTENGIQILCYKNISHHLASRLCNLLRIRLEDSNG